MSNHKKLECTIVFILFVSAAPGLFGASYTWNSATSGNWTNTANWLPDTGYPVSGDTASFTGVGAGVTVYVYSARTVAQIISSINITFGGGSTLTVSGNLNVTAGSLAINTPVIVGGNVSVTNGAMSQTAALTVNGTTTINTAANIILANASNNFTGIVTVTNAGMLTLRDTNALSFGGASTISGTLTATAGGNITQSGGSLVVTGAISMTVPGGSDIILDGGNTLSGTLAFNAASGAIRSLSIVDSTAVDLPALTLSGNLSVTLTGSGAITDSGNLVVPGTTVLDAGSTRSITLDSAGNNFTGNVTIASAFDASIRDMNAIVFGDVAVSGVFSVTAAGNISQAVMIAVSVAQGTILAAGTGGSVVLDAAGNDFRGTMRIPSANNVTLRDANALEFTGASTISGALTATAGGSITQSGGSLAVTNALSMSVAGGCDIILDAANTFSGTLAFSVTGAGTIRNLTITDSNAVALPALTLSGNLSVTITGTGTLTDAGALSVGGTTTISTGTGNDVALDNGNDFTGDVTIAAARNVVLIDSNSIRFGDASAIAGTFSLTTSGNISQASGATVSVAQTMSLAAGTGGNIVLDNTGNTFSGAVTIVSSLGATLRDSDGFVFGAASTISGALAVRAGGSITQSGAALSVTGNSSFYAPNGSDILLDAANTFNGTLGFSAYSGSIRHLTIVDSTGVDLPAVVVSGNLSVTLSTAGAITDSGNVVVTGTTVLDTGDSRPITLDSAGNNFGGYVSILSALNATVRDTNAITLGDITVSGALSVIASGNITQSSGAIITVPGTASFSAGANAITLGNTSNSLPTLTIASGAHVTLDNFGSIALNATASLASLYATVDSLMLASDIVITGALTVDGGNFDVSEQNRRITLGGNWSSAGAVFNARAGTVVFNGGATSTLDSGAANVADEDHDFYNVTIAGATIVDVSAAPIRIANILRIEQDTGVFDSNGVDFSIDTTSFNSNRGTLELHGTQAVQIVANHDIGTGRVLYSGSSSTGQVLLVSFHDLNIGCTGTRYLADSIDVYGDFTLLSGSLDAGSYTISLHGNFDSTNGGTFAYNESTVDFVGTGAQLEQRVLGDNTFNNISTTVSGKTIRFEAGSTTTIVSGGRCGAEGDPDSILFCSTVDGSYWYFTLSGGAVLSLVNVTVRDSNAINPIVKPDQVTVGSHCYNWIDYLVVTATSTEDGNRNGKIDRIRVEAAANINDDFSEVTIALLADSGYAVDTRTVPRGMSTGAGPTTPLPAERNDRVFYIWLEEKTALDTGSTPDFRITANTSLEDFSYPNPKRLEVGERVYDPADNADPLLGYILAEAGRGEAFIHLSEPLSITPPQCSFNFGAGGVNPSEIRPVSSREFLLVFTGQTFTASHIVAQNTIVFSGIVDSAGNALEGAPGSYTHRISDLAIGATGFEPVRQLIAFYTDPTERTWDPERGGIGTINVFDSTRFLQDRDFTVQTSLDPALSGSAITMYFDSNVSASAIRNGLWLPQGVGTLGLVPGENTVPPENQIAQTVPGSPPERREFYLIDTHSDIFGGVVFDFFIRFPTGMYAARVDRPAAGDWYRTVRPYSFRIHEPGGQKGRVVVFNNVFTPGSGESVKLRYVLNRPGMVTIELFSLSGEVVDVLQRGRMDAGEHSTSWDGQNRGRRICSSGVYFIRIVGPDIDETRKVLIVK